MRELLPGIAVAFGAIAVIFCSFLLFMNIMTRHAESYRTLIIAGAIILGSGTIAWVRGRKDS